MAEDEVQVLAAAKKLPLDERVEHKNWKVRSEAYEDIRGGCERAFSSSDPILGQSGPLFAKSVGDANANAMDKALDALCAWLQKADENQAHRLVGGACSTMAAKCLKARPGTVAKVTEASMLFIELEQQAAVVEATLKALGDKVPKTVIAALDVLYRAICNFGAKIVDPKPILKALPAVFGHSNAGVRDKAKELTIELAAWVGAPVVQSVLLEKMSDAMRKDVEGAIQALPPGKKKAERFTRKEAVARAAGEGDGDEVDAAGGPEPMQVDDAAAVDFGDGDPFEFSDPVDIMGPLSKSMVIVGDDSVPFWDCFESKKWNIRKGAIDKLKEAAKAPRLSPGEYHDICRELRKVLAKDANITCAASAAEAVGALAQGLRKDFSSHARQLSGAVMERFKEKNTIMSKAADEALRTMATYCYGLPDVTEELAAHLAHKNPKVRLDTLRLLKDMVDASERPLVAKCKDPLVPATVKLAPDADANIREAAQSVLVAYALKLGSYNAIQSYVSKLDDTRSKIIETAVMEAAKAGTQGGAKPPQRAAPAAAKPAAAAPPSRASARPSSSSSAASAGARGSPKPPAGRAPAGSRPASGARPRAAAAARPSPVEDDSFDPSRARVTSEEAQDRLTDAVGSSVVEGLRSSAWQARVESMTAVAEHATANASQPDAAILLLCVAQLPGWGDKNFQVVNKCLEVATILAQGCPGYSKAHAAATVEGAGDKIHELKHRIPATEALTAACEAVGPRFVVAQLHTRAAANKNPKVLSESLSWICTIIDEFGLATMDLGALLGWLIADLGSPNAPVRNQAMAALGRCHAQVGGGLMAQLSESLKPAQVTMLEEIFRKNPHDPSFQPSKKVKSKRGGGGGGGAAAEAGGGFAAMDIDEEDAAPVNSADLLPRANISSQLSPSLLGQLSSSNWKERNAALEEIEGILRSAGGRIQPDLPTELFAGLRGRMTDTNRNLAARTLLLIGKLAEAVGPPFDRLARPVLVPTLSTLSDNKKQVRDAVIVMLDAWLGTCPGEKLFPPVVDVVANPKVNVEGRVAAMAWMQRAISDGKASKCADSAVRAAGIALGDKSAGVREGATQLLAEVAGVLGTDELMRALGTLDSSTRKVAEPVVLKVVAASGSRPGSSKPTTTAAAAASPPPAAAAALERPSSRFVTAPTASRPSTLSINEQEAQPLLAMNSTKAVRARQFRMRPGKFENPPSDELENLEAAFALGASDDFLRLLFSKDFKDHLRAADALSNAMPDLLNEAVANLDLIFRWAIVRICEGNTQLLVRVLEMLRVLLDALSDAGYRLNESEAACLIPAIVEKAGHNQDRVRGLHRDVLRASCAVYPPVRLVDHLIAGLASKNNRTKIESCEFMAELVDTEGVAVLANAKSKPMTVIAVALKERDGSLRNAALSVVEAVWAKEGTDTVFKMLGRIEGREKEMVEDRLRRSSRQPADARGGGGGIAAAAAFAAASAALATAAMDRYAESEGNGHHAEDDYNPTAGRYDYEMGLPPAAAKRAMGYPSAYEPTTTAAVPEMPPSDLAYSRPAFTPPNALDMSPIVSHRIIADDYAERGAEVATPPVYQVVGPAGQPTGASAYDNHRGNGADVQTPVPRGLPATPIPQPVDSPQDTVASAAPELPAAPPLPARPPIPATGPDDSAFERRWAEQLNAMASPSLPTAVNATKQLCAEIMAVADVNADPPASRRIRVVMGSSAERLFTVVLAQLSTIFEEAAKEAAAGGTPSSRGCKFALNVMLQGMSVDEVAGGLPQGTLRQAISLLLCRLVDERGLLIFEEGPTLVRAVNVLIAKMLESANRNYSFAALLQLLREPPSSLPYAAVPKFNDLVVKCLIKLTKGLQTSMAGVDMSALLLNIHDFFMFLGVDEIRRRSSADDKPLRMVKTVLHELCKMAGHKIYLSTAGIPGRKADPQPIIFAYIGLNLASLEQSGLIAPATGEDQQLVEMKQQEAEMLAAKAAAVAAATAGGNSAPNAASSAEVQAAAQKAEVKARLKGIMTRLVQRDPTQQKVAMVELHRLRKEHPQYVERYIAGTSEMFRQFIDNGLRALDAQGGADLDGPSVPRLVIPSGQPGGNTSPHGSGRSDGSTNRITSLRERLSNMKADGAAGQASRSSSNVDLNGSQGAGHPSVEDLTARLNMLRRKPT